MSHRPLQLGPDPNRTHLERWNEMHPDRYGRPDTYEADSSRRQRHTANDADNGGTSSGLFESLLGVAILILAPLAGAITTLLIYRWTAPGQLTTGWVLGYLSTFLVTAWVSGMLVYALRRLLLAAAIAGAIFGIGYLAWHFWLG